MESNIQDSHAGRHQLSEKDGNDGRNRLRKRPRLFQAEGGAETKKLKLSNPISEWIAGVALAESDGSSDGAADSIDAGRSDGAHERTLTYTSDEDQANGEGSVTETTDKDEAGLGDAASLGSEPMDCDDSEDGSDDGVATCKAPTFEKTQDEDPILDDTASLASEPMDFSEDDSGDEAASCKTPIGNKDESGNEEPIDNQVAIVAEESVTVKSSDTIPKTSAAAMSSLDPVGAEDDTLVGEDSSGKPSTSDQDAISNQGSDEGAGSPEPRTSNEDAIKGEGSAGENHVSDENGTARDEEESNHEDMDAPAAVPYSPEAFMDFIDFTGLDRPTDNLLTDDEAQVGLDEVLFNLLQIDTPLNAERTMQLLIQILDAHCYCQDILVLSGKHKYREAMKKRLLWFFRFVGVPNRPVALFNWEKNTLKNFFTVLWETIDGLRRCRIRYVNTIPQGQPLLPAGSSSFLTAIHRCTERLQFLGPDFGLDLKTDCKLCSVDKKEWEVSSPLKGKKYRALTNRYQVLYEVKNHALRAGTSPDKYKLAQKWLDLWGRLEGGSLDDFVCDRAAAYAEYASWQKWACERGVDLPPTAC